MKLFFTVVPIFAIYDQLPAIALVKSARIGSAIVDFVNVQEVDGLLFVQSTETVGETSEMF